MTEEEAGNDRVLPQSGRNAEYAMEREHSTRTERQESVQEHGRSRTPSKASGSYRSRIQVEV